MGNFVHLHLHTEYSLLDGATRIDQVFYRAKELGQDAVAITDHGNMYGVVPFYRASKKAGVKAIIGCEFYVADDLTYKQGRPKPAHLVLLVKNEEGYRNIIKLNSIAYVDGFYFKPRIDYKTLAKYSGGLVCLSGCLAGDIPKALLEHRPEDAKEYAIKLRDMFAPGDFYIELQDHGMIEQKEILMPLYNLAKEIGVECVATNDVHYLNKEDAKAQDILLCVQTQKMIDDPDRMRMPNDEFYFKSEEEMLETFAFCKEAVYNTAKVAEKCNYDITFDGKYYPTFTPPTGQSSYDYLHDKMMAGLEKRYDKITKEIIDRAEFELSVISGNGYVDYYLVVADFIEYAETHGVPIGIGRGSGAASIVAYAIGITKLDPLKYNLFFERFLNPERVSPPDFDIDLCSEGRSKVIDYVTEKYGKECVCQIAAFGCLKAKQAIKDVVRVLKMPYSEGDKLTKLMPPSPQNSKPMLKYYFGIEKKDNLAIPELVDYYNDDPSIKEVVDYAIKLENMPRQVSMHAAGVVICCDAVDKFVPLARLGESIVTQVEKNEAENIGLLKMDFLGLRTLTDINKALKYIKENHNIDIDFYDKKFTYDDPKVFQLISSGETDAVFQIESGGMKKFMKELLPDCIEDIIAGVALYRPGPMDEIPTYCKNKKNPSLVEYVDERLKDILDVTYGVIVYQEQVMKIVQVLAGYTLAQADWVRKIMGKKKIDLLPAEKQKFLFGWEDPSGKHSIIGAVKNGVKQEVAEKLWAQMEKFGSYAFNKAHAACYAFLSYQTGYLKVYFEPEFMSSILNNRITDIDEIKKYVVKCKSRGINVLPPDINKSKTYFSTNGKDIRFGLAALKGVGIGVCDSIIKEREENGEFKDLVDFVRRVNSLAHNKRTLESFILSGAFDCFNLKRSVMMEVYPTIVERAQNERKSKDSGQISLFGEGMLDDSKILWSIDYPNLPEFIDEVKLKFEKDVAGLYVSGHPLEKYQDKFKEYTLTSDMLSSGEEEYDENSDEIEVDLNSDIEDGKEVICGGIITEIRKTHTKNGGREMAGVIVEDLYGPFDMVAFPNIYARIKDKLVIDSLVTIKGKILKKGGSDITISIEEIKPWEKNTETVITENKSTSVLWLKYNKDDTQKHNKIIDILRQQKGYSDVKILSNGKQYLMPVKVMINSYLENELYGILGYENVKVVKKV